MQNKQSNGLLNWITFIKKRIKNLIQTSSQKAITSDQEAIDHNIQLLQDHIIPMLKKRYIKKINNVEDIKQLTCVYIQLHLRRCVELTEGIVNSAQNNHPLVAISCARTILETVAYFNAFHRQLKASVKKGDQKEAYKVIDKYMRATRDEEYLKRFSQEDAEHYKTTHIQTQLPKLAKRNSDVEKQYDELSEIIHPNYGGLFGLYGALGKNNTITFSPAEKAEEKILKAMVEAGKYLKSLCHISNEILDLLNELESKK